MTTPNDIEILIHFHCSMLPHPRRDAPAVRKTIADFLADGIIEPGTGEAYRTTEKGSAWLRMICRVEPPRQAWVDESGAEV
jgi:hypothetical protein